MAVTMEAERPDVSEARIRSGDPESEPVASVTIDLVFEEAFEDLYLRAYGVAFQLLGRRSEAEDVAQETLARAFVRWRRIRSYAEAWVVRVAGNLAIDAWRRRQRVDTTGDAERRGATAPGPDGQRVDLHRALDALSRRQREVIVLRFLADLPEADVAKALGCSVGSVKQHASRGLATLRASMSVDDAGDDRPDQQERH
ncbi:MAG TPA: sigma-70 family RNA polymerase sigma factor [Acidimicrobiia bacterium]|nr:sigma-70 family RNA polymerase sigma factor [Acidimicrobiia bacterium]